MTVIKLSSAEHCPKPIIITYHKPDPNLQPDPAPNKRRDPNIELNPNPNQDPGPDSHPDPDLHLDPNTTPSTATITTQIIIIRTGPMVTVACTSWRSAAG